MENWRKGDAWGVSTEGEVLVRETGNRKQLLLHNIIIILVYAVFLSVVVI